MVQGQCSTVEQRVEVVSRLIAHRGSYGEVSQLSRQIGTSRQTLYAWRGKGQQALEQALMPVAAKDEDEATVRIERAILTLLVEGHASYRGIQHCIEELLGEQVSLGKIAAVVEEAGQRAQQWFGSHGPVTACGLAFDEMYGARHGVAYLSAVEVHSGVVWASTGLVGVDGESWTLLLWELQEQGVHWQTAVSDGGRAIGEAVATVTPQGPINGMSGTSCMPVSRCKPGWIGWWRGSSSALRWLLARRHAWRRASAHGESVRAAMCRPMPPKSPRRATPVRGCATCPANCASCSAWWC